MSSQAAGGGSSQLSLVSAPAGQTTAWEVPADIEYVTAQLCAGARSTGGTPACVSARVKVTEAQMLKLTVGRTGQGTALLDTGRPVGSKGLIAIGANGSTNVGTTDVTDVTNVSPTPGSGSDGSATLWLPPAPVHAVARAVNGDGSVLNVLYTLHVVQNAASNVYHGVGPVLFPMDVTGVEYSIDGGTTWQHSGGPPPAAGSAGTFSIRNLTPATNYTVLVRAVNGAGPGIQGSSTVTTARPATSATSTSTTVPATVAPTTTAPTTTTPTTTTIAPATTAATTTTLPTTTASSTTQAPSTTTTSTSVVPSTTTSIAPSTSTTSLPVTTSTSVPSTTRPPSPTTRAPTTSTLPAPSPTTCERTPSEGWYQDTIGAVGSTVTIPPCVPSGATPSSYAITGGSLPTGVVLDNDAGVISGTPTESASGAGEVQLTATLPDGSTVVSTLRIGINQMGHPLGYPNRNIGTVGHPTVITPTQALTSGSVRFSLVSGTLPIGLELDGSTGVISGTPTTPVERPAPIVIRSQDATGPSEASFVIIVNSAGAAVPWVRYPDNAFQVTGENVQVRPMTSDLPAGVSFTLSGGGLPSGLSLDPATGIVSGVASKPVETSGLLVTAIGPDRTPMASAALDLTLIGTLGQPTAKEVTASTNWWWPALLIVALLLAGLAVAAILRRRTAPVSRH